MILYLMAASLFAGMIENFNQNNEKLYDHKYITFSDCIIDYHSVKR